MGGKRIMYDNIFIKKVVHEEISDILKDPVAFLKNRGTDGVRLLEVRRNADDVRPVCMIGLELDDDGDLFLYRHDYNTGVFKPQYFLETQMLGEGIKDLLEIENNWKSRVKVVTLLIESTEPDFNEQSLEIDCSDKDITLKVGSRAVSFYRAEIRDSRPATPDDVKN